MADRAPRRGSLPMSGARLTAALECANDAGVRFTLRRPGDSHGASRLSADAAASCASADRPASAVRAALTGTGATPPADALVMAWAGAGFHKPRTAPGGVAPVPMIPRGKAADPPTKTPAKDLVTSPARPPSGINWSREKYTLWRYSSAPCRHEGRGPSLCCLCQTSNSFQMENRS